MAATALPLVAAATPADKVVATMKGVGTHQDGTVRLTEGGDGTLVVFVLMTGGAGTFEPASIVRGSCAKIGPELKSLTNLSGGRSMSAVSGLNYNIVRQGDYAVVVRASPFNHTVVSCGNIGRNAHATNQLETGGYGGRTTP
jgi:hypothetical protein